MKLAVFTFFAFFVVAVVAVSANVHTKQSGSGDVKFLWQNTVGISAANAPYYNASKNWLYVNGASEVAILHGSTGTKIKSVPSSGSRGFSDVVPGDNGKIYYTGWGTLFCRDAETLDLVWNYTSRQEFGYTPLYVASEKAVYVGQRLQNVTVRIKFDAETGKLLWTYTGEIEPHNPTTSKILKYSEKHGVLLSSTRQGLLALRGADGSKAWFFSTRTGIYTKPVLSDDEDSVFFGTTGDNDFKKNDLYSADTATGKQNWRTALSDPFSTTPLLDNGTLYFPTAGYTSSFSQAVEAATGKVLWKKKLSGQALAENWCITRKYGDAMVFSTITYVNDTISFGIEAAALKGSGTVWSWNGADNFVFNIMTPQPDGKFFVGDEGGNVFALQLPGGSPSTGGTVVEKRCTDMDCSQDCETHRYQVTKCVQTSSSRSVRRQCLSNGKLLIQEFSESATCDQFTAHNDAEYAPGKCYGQNFGGSVEVVSCSA